MEAASVWRSRYRRVRPHYRTPNKTSNRSTLWYLAKNPAQERSLPSSPLTPDPMSRTATPSTSLPLAHFSVRCVIRGKSLRSKSNKIINAARSWGRQKKWQGHGRTIILRTQCSTFICLHPSLIISWFWWTFTSGQNQRMYNL